MKTCISLILSLLFINVSAQIKEVQTMIKSSESIDNIYYSLKVETQNQSNSTTTLIIEINPSTREKKTAEHFNKSILPFDYISLDFIKASNQFNDLIEILKRIVIHLDSKSSTLLELESSDSKGYRYKFTVYQDGYIKIIKYPYPGDNYINTREREVEYKTLKQLYNQLKSL